MTRGSGVLTRADLDQARNDIASHPDFDRTFNLLVDLAYGLVDPRIDIAAKSS